MPTSKKKVQEINAGSMADIAFLLLIFFLVATTMNVDTGIQRVLPPIPEKNQKAEVDIRERNLLLVHVNKFNQVAVANEIVDIRLVKDRAKEFMLNLADDPNLPEKEETEIEGLPGGKYMVSKGVISLQNDRGTSYDTYIRVQNELTRAVNEIRDQVSQEKFHKPFSELDEAQRKAIQAAVPQKISEAEPKNVGGK